jgi:prepilin-type N-terminal cleavage/methylation domain-containing protein
MNPLNGEGMDSERRTGMSRPGRTRRGGAAAFTLVELLTVISIMAILAGLVVAGLQHAGKVKKIHQANTLLTKVQDGIDRYKLELGSYPPDNPTNSFLNGLYYELVGMVLNPATQTFSTLNGSENLSATTLSNTLNVSGFVNCSEDPAKVKGFVQSFGSRDSVQLDSASPVRILQLPLEGPNDFVSSGGVRINPVHYNASAPVHVPAKYDLWIEFMIGRETNIVSNWRR